MAGARPSSIEESIAPFDSALLRARILTFSAMLLLILGGPALPESKPDKYVLRIAHETGNETTCVLLQRTGTFHYESGDRENTKVYEGQLSATQLSSVEANLQAVTGFSQEQIEEPLINGTRDLLDIHLFKSAGVKELLFRSSESQEPFMTSLKPLLQWMNTVRKLPHRELSEDAGKNNCLPKRALALRKRDEITLEPPLPRTPVAGRRIVPLPPAAAVPPRVPPLVRLELLEKNSSRTQQRCAVVASDGRYRFELRSQKNERTNVETRIAQGEITAEEMQQLQKILDAPALATIHHHEPPDTMPLNIMGSVLELSIYRPAGLQELALTDSKHRTTFFYAGDADISRANDLLQFIWRHVGRRAMPATAREGNGCSTIQ